MEFANYSNPKTDKILIGDKSNKKLAADTGWEWIDLDGFSTDRIAEFNRSFVTLSGSRHKNIRNKRNWTHYSFFRWFVIEEFLNRHDIEEFWHFDSDTLIIENLSEYDYLQNKHLSMMQCNSSCLNGFVKRSVVNLYCESVLEQFKNEQLLEKYRKEFEVNKRFAFVDMGGFKNFNIAQPLPFVSGMELSRTFVFDDCLCQSHGFDCVDLPDSRRVKQIYFEKGKAFFIKEKQKVLAATLNLSWLNEAVNDAIIRTLKAKAQVTLTELNLPFLLKLVGFLRRIKRLLK
jgi:hypothetical protein